MAAATHAGSSSTRPRPGDNSPARPRPAPLTAAVCCGGSLAEGGRDRQPGTVPSTAMNTPNLLPAAILLAFLAGCTTSPDSATRNGVVGSWFAYDEEKRGVAAFIFKPDRTGGAIAGDERTGPLGRTFTYSVDGSTVSITPQGLPPFEATITGETMQVPGAKTPYRRAGDDEPQLVRDYLAELERAMARSAKGGGG